jgi:hypothetical protein
MREFKISRKQKLKSWFLNIAAAFLAGICAALISLFSQKNNNEF